MPKLIWNVKCGADGGFLRRRLDGDGLGLEVVDVEWTHADGAFPADTKVVPTTHPPNIEYKTVEAGRREVVCDSVTVPPEVTDGTVAMMLDGKRAALARALGVEP